MFSIKFSSTINTQEVYRTNIELNDIPDDPCINSQRKPWSTLHETCSRQYAQRTERCHGFSGFLWVYLILTDRTMLGVEAEKIYPVHG